MRLFIRGPLIAMSEHLAAHWCPIQLDHERTGPSGSPGSRTSSPHGPTCRTLPRRSACWARTPALPSRSGTAPPVTSASSAPDGAGGAAVPVVADARVPLRLGGSPPREHTQWTEGRERACRSAENTR
jgi:hypothetical protein